ncbi:MAG: LemA family protein [Patescibacteria group bacterium]|jgi:LemA protein
MTVLPIIILVFVVLFVLYVWGTYNQLIVLKNRLDEAWSGIEVQLKRRADLIPNLVETVKGYAKHEKSVFENVTKARAQMMSAGSVKDMQKADNMLTGALKSLFAVAEAYPDLKANTNFQDLQKEVADTEDKVAYSRQFYNSNVLNYNNLIQMFPSNLLAAQFHFQQKEFFEADVKDRGPVKVSFKE